MVGLSKNIEKALIEVIKGLDYSVNTQEVDDDKISQAMSGKITSFKSAKKLLHRWISSQNAPSKEKISFYAESLISSGRKGLENLASALSEEIDYDSLDDVKHRSAIAARPIILDAYYELENLIKEIELQIEGFNFNFLDKEFKIGYPERFSNGEFYNIDNYYKKWYEERIDAVNICPFGTRGSVIELDGLKVMVPVRSKIDRPPLFSDLPITKQYWRRTPPPDITPDNIDSYTDYIIEEFRRRREGVFFKNKGKVVYLTGNHYFALQWCEMFDKGKYMDFREAQLNIFYHLQACIVDTRCLGQVFVKSRRTGFTYTILSILLNNSTSLRNSLFGMTSKSQRDVEEMFFKFSYMFQNLPFFFKPVVKRQEDGKNGLEFAKPSDTSKESKKSRETTMRDYLNTKVDWRTATNGAYDSVALTMYLGDEFGKWAPPNDYVRHLNQISPTMMPSGRVVGKAFIGSTIGALEQGGDNAKEIYYNSDITKRDKKTEKTGTSLYSFFLAAQDNMEEFTDIYGKCWTEKPPAGTLNVLGEIIKMGSNEYLDAIEESARAQSEKNYSEQKRAYPRCVEDCFRNTEEYSVFNRNKIFEQISHNTKIGASGLYAVGNFDWVNEKKDGKVTFNPCQDGRFKVAWMPSIVDGTEDLQNRVREYDGRFYPMNKDLGAAGCDPFAFASTHGKGSKGAVHAVSSKVSLSGAPANKFMFEYLSRPSDEIFFEDVIKVLRFYGIPILVESNRNELLRHMYNRGYRGFAIDRVDKQKHELTPHEEKYGGQAMSSKDILDAHMNVLGSWIENYVGVSNKGEIRPIGEMGDMPFNDTLKDWLTFNPEKRTKFDATVSSGLALMAVNKDRFKKVTKEVVKPKLGSYIKIFNRNNSIIRSL